jgi:hypothetical protein
MLKNTPNTPEEALAEWRNENAKQIDAAVKLLRPESRYDVETALIEMKYEYRQLRIGFIDKHKPAKLAARDLAKALERVQRLMKNKDLPIQLHLGLPDEAIEKTLEACKKIATTPSRKIPRKKAELKRLAIRKAAACMSKHPIKRDNASVRSTLVGLSTILWVVTVSEKGTGQGSVYGDPKANLTSQCAAFLREARKAK